MKGIVRNSEGGIDFSLIDFSFFVPASLAFDLVPATLVPASSINVLVNKQYIHESYTYCPFQDRFISAGNTGSESMAILRKNSGYIISGFEVQDWFSQHIT